MAQSTVCNGSILTIDAIAENREPSHSSSTPAARGLLRNIQFVYKAPLAAIAAIILTPSTTTYTHHSILNYHCIVSASHQRRLYSRLTMVIKIKMENAPIEEAEPEAIIPMEVVSSGGQSATNSTGTTGRLRRKAARRSEPLYIRRSPRRLGKAAAEDVPARKKPRLEEPLPTTTDEAASKNSSPEVSVGLPSPPPAADADANTNAVPVTDTQLDAVATGRWTTDEDADLTSAIVNTSKKKRGSEYKIDWAAVAALVPGRTRKQCNERWKNGLGPSIDRTSPGNTGRWTEDEDVKLKDTVKRHGGKNWDEIAALVPNRSSNQCRSRWHNTLYSSTALTAGRTGKWTADEDEKLKDAVQTHGGKDWIAITALVPGRTRNQCKRRWKDVLDPNIALTAGRTGKWTPDEDDKLKDTVERHGGKNWDEITALVPGRSQKQCRNRWHYVNRPDDGM
jgi:hypothetical protein